MSEEKKNECCCSGGDCGEEMDELQYLYCTECQRLVVVVEECSCKDGCRIQCCGKPMINPDEVPNYAGTVFECKKCHAKIIIEEDSFNEGEDKPNDFICCGAPMEVKPE